MDIDRGALGRRAQHLPTKQHKTLQEHTFRCQHYAGFCLSWHVFLSIFFSALFTRRL